MPSRNVAQSNDLILAIQNRDIEKVRALLVTWDSIKKRRMDVAVAGPRRHPRDTDSSIRARITPSSRFSSDHDTVVHNCGWGPVTHALWMLADPQLRSLQHAENEQSYKILEIILEAGLSCGHCNMSFDHPEHQHKFRYQVMYNLMECRCPSVSCIFFEEMFKYVSYEPVSGLVIRNPDAAKLYKLFLRNGLQCLKEPRGLLHDLARFNQVEVAKILFDHVGFFPCDMIDANALSRIMEMTRYHRVSADFLNVLLDHQSASCWASDEDVDSLVLCWWFSSANPELFQALINHGLPPVSHSMLRYLIHSGDSSKFDRRVGRVRNRPADYRFLLQHVTGQSRQKHESNLFYSCKIESYQHGVPDKDLLEILQEFPANRLRSFTNTVHGPQDDDCAICCEQFQSGDEMVKLDCGHIFHLDCMLDVASVSEDDRCPNCRQRWI